MSSEERLTKLISENAFLQSQIEELTELAVSYRREIKLLNEKYGIEAELRSIIENNSEETEYLKYQLEKEKQKVIIVSKRESAMELELLENIKMETAYYNIKDQQRSDNARILDLSDEIRRTTLVYKNLEEANRKISEISSLNDILKEENELLQYQLKSKKKSEI